MPHPSMDKPEKLSLYAYEKLILIAIALSPLQSAFTLDVGFPLKLSELCLGFGIILYVFGRHRKAGITATHRAFILLGSIVVLSTITALFAGPPAGYFPGYTRSLNADMLLYTGYAGLVIIMWLIASKIPSSAIAKALIIAVWVCGIGSLMQWGLGSLGQIDFLESLNFETKAKGFSLDGDDTGVMRSGPFVEGQHLGFFAGAGVIIALRYRRYLTLLVALICLFYSQSTTGFLGLGVALVITLLARPRVSQIIKILLGTIMFGGLALLIPEVRVLAKYQLAKLGLFGFADDYSGADISIDLRSAKTEIGFQIASEHPFFGVGPGRYGAFFFDHATAPPIPFYYFNMPDHRALAENIYAQIAAELGIVALLVFCFGFLALMASMLRSRPIDLGFLAFLAISFSTQSNWTFIPVWVFLAYSMSIVNDLHRSGTLPASTRKTSILHPAYSDRSTNIKGFK